MNGNIHFNGELLTVGGHKMHIFRQGQSQGPALVFMSGHCTIAPVYDFKVLYEKLAQHCRIIVLEKFGYGYSDICDSPCDIDTLVSLQRQTLSLAGEAGPYVLIPHSMSGLEAIRWKQQFPDEVAAIIGIDISFTRLLKWVDTLKYQETGYMYLKEADGSAHYHYSDLDLDHMHTDEEDQITENGELMSQPRTGGALVRYTFQGRDRAMAFVTLRNGMKFVLCDGYDSVFKARNRAINIMIWVSVAMTTVLAAIAALMANASRIL